MVNSLKLCDTVISVNGGLAGAVLPVLTQSLWFVITRPLQNNVFRGSICASGCSVSKRFAILNVDTSFLVELLLKKFCQTYIFNAGHLMLNFYTLLRVSRFIIWHIICHILHESYVIFWNEILELKMKISEIGIKWEEIEGTKMVPVLSWIQMARDLVMIWCRYTIRYWTVSSK